MQNRYEKHTTYKNTNRKYEMKEHKNITKQKPTKYNKIRTKNKTQIITKITE